MNITVYVTNQNGDEVEEKDRLVWYPNLVKAIEAYISIFNNLPQIGIDIFEADDLDPITIKGININPANSASITNRQQYSSAFL